MTSSGTPNLFNYDSPKPPAEIIQRPHTLALLGIGPLVIPIPVHERTEKGQLASNRSKIAEKYDALVDELVRIDGQSFSFEGPKIYGGVTMDLDPQGILSIRYSHYFAPAIFTKYSYRQLPKNVNKKGDEVNHVLYSAANIARDTGALVRNYTDIASVTALSALQTAEDLLHLDR